MASKSPTASKNEPATPFASLTSRTRIRIHQESASLQKQLRSRQRKLGTGSKIEDSAIELLLLHTGGFPDTNCFYKVYRAQTNDYGKSNLRGEVENENRKSSVEEEDFEISVSEDEDI